MSVQKALGHVANLRGKTNETRVLHVISDSTPAWVEKVRSANPEEDAKGVDVVVYTDVGKLFLQVKSSKAGIKAYSEKKRRSMIGVVLCHHRISDERLRKSVYRELAKLRETVLKKRQAK